MSTSYLSRLREGKQKNMSLLGTAQTAKTNLRSLCSSDPGDKNSSFPEKREAANDTGPKLDDLDPAGREAGLRIYQALLAPRPKVEPVARATPTVADATHYRWLIHYSDRDPVEATYSPEASCAEVLALHPTAIAAEPLERTPLAGKPLSNADERRLRDWLASIGETDPIVLDAFWAQVARDPEALRYFLGFAA